MLHMDVVRYCWEDVGGSPYHVNRHLNIPWKLTPPACQMGPNLILLVRMSRDL